MPVIHCWGETRSLLSPDGGPQGQYHPTHPEMRFMDPFDLMVCLIVGNNILWGKEKRPRSPRFIAHSEDQSQKAVIKLGFNI